MKSGKIILILVLTATTLLSLGNCVSRSPVDPRGEAYAGSASCRPCHARLFSSFSHTAHFLSTRIASAQTILGSFAPPLNSVQLSTHRVLKMEQDTCGYFQILYDGDTAVRSRRIDLVMGTVKGQTYLSKTDEGYSELPASWTIPSGRWTASPGFSLDRMSFDRPVTRRCLECHSAWMPDPASLSGVADPGSVSAVTDPVPHAVFSIDCERCHGPAAAHVLFHTGNPEVKEASSILRISELTRKQKMDLCATCHSGTKQTMLRSTYGFKPGDSLENFMIPDFMGTLTPDVHGNQSRALAASRCFRDPALECNSCHNTHEVARGAAELFNARCLQCHSGNNLHAAMGSTIPASLIQKQCTACHMPLQPSGNITMQTVRDSAAMAAMIVNHRIGIYPEVTAAILKKFSP